MEFWFMIRASGNRNSRTFLTLFSSRPTDTLYEASVSATVMHRSVHRGESTAPYNRYFHPGVTPPLVAGITDQDIIKSLYLQQDTSRTYAAHW